MLALALALDDAAVVTAGAVGATDPPRLVPAAVAPMVAAPVA